MMKKIIGFIICSMLLTTSGLSVAVNDKNRNSLKEDFKSYNLEAFKPLNQFNNWPTFMHSPNHSGYTTSQGPVNDNILWSVMVNGITGSPVVADGKVFLPYYPIKRGTSFLSSYDAFTGEILWTFSDSTGGYADCAPAYCNDRVYFQSMCDFFYCLDADTGEEIWNYSASSWGSSPTVVNDSVFFCTFTSVVCLNATTGSELWTYEPGEYEGCSPAVVNNRVYVCQEGTCGGNDALVICLDKDTGEKIWSFLTGTVMWNSASVVDGRVYAGSNDYLFCLDAEIGSELWRYPIHTFATPAVAYDQVYIGSYNWTYCLDADDGSFVWKFFTGWNHCELSSPAVSDGKVYVSTRGNGTLYCHDAFTGGIIWSKKLTETYIESSPALAYNNLYIGAGYGHDLYAFGSNDPPYTPIIDGPTEGLVNVDYEFSFETTDPDEDDIYYYIDWGDGNFEKWIGPYESDEEVKVNHNWTSGGDFNIKAKARDSYANETDWSDPLTIHITNEPPDAPTIDGPTSGNAGTAYTFTFNSIDPDGKDVYYYIKWDDIHIEYWNGPHPSGVDFEIKHSFPLQKTFTIEAKAKDNSNDESNWSYFDIEIPRNRMSVYSLFQLFFERFPLLEKLLTLIRVI